MSFTTLETDRDVFVARSLPGTSRIIASDGYDRVQIIDCATATPVATIALPTDDEPFSISEWYVDPTGAWSLAIDRERLDHALLVDHHALQAKTIPLPATMGPASGTCWFDDHLQWVTHDGLCWGLQDEEIRLEPPSPSLLAWGERVKRRLLQYERFNQIRTDLGSGIAYFVSHDAELAGTVTIPGAEVQTAPGDQAITGVAGSADVVFVSFRDRVCRYRNGKLVSTFEPAANERVQTVVSAHGPGAHYLVILCALGSGQSRVHFTRDSSPATDDPRG